MFYSNKAIISLLASFLLSAVISNAAENQEITIDEDGSYVLEDMIVYRKANLSNVEYEADGSLSITTNNIETMMSALDSGDGVALNIVLAFAPNSIVLTADGRHMLDLLLDSIQFVKRRSQFEVHSYSSKNKPRLSTARSNSLVNALGKAYVGLHKFKLIENASPPTAESIRDSANRMIFTLVKTEGYIETKSVRLNLND